ncbi:MAG TPA: DUF2950 domain-containing protein [Aliidongia sp.]|nr:DUF2950 domain-containing protein [Aliidongia sp.]
MRSARLAMIALMGLSGSALAATPVGRDFPTPGAAIAALIAAARTDRTADLVRILGPAGRDLVNSGDPVADHAGRAQFVSNYDQGSKLVEAGPDRTVLEIGSQDWPFPIPLVRRHGTWHFDTASGRQEILDRRIGRNELGAIEVCRAYAAAQMEFARMKAARRELVEYAQQFESSPGQHDGLFWPQEEGGPESPLGPQIVSARAEGYRKAEGGQAPYHGYFYKILTRQGPAAPGGAYDYLAHGHMIGGFALVAFPARWGDSGVMSFLISEDGTVYEKNLGPDGPATARAMTAFDPDRSWRKVETSGEAAQAR